MYLSVGEVSSRLHESERRIYEKIKEKIFPYDKFEYIKGYCISWERFIEYFRTPVKEMTKYPKYFDCYWGAFRMSTLADDEKKIRSIIENRNSFIESRAIFGNSDRKIYLNKNIVKAFDHVEKYKSKDRKGDCLVVSSPYLSPSEIEEVLPDGFIFDYLPDMYGAGSTTFSFWYSDNKKFLKRKGFWSIA